MNERTLIIIKPDAYARGLCGEILNRLERTGLRITKIRVSKGEKQLVDNHYPTDTEWISNVGATTINDYASRGESAELVFGTNDPYEVGSQIRSWLSEYLLSGPLIPCELAGNRAVTAVRNLIGDTLPIRATPGSIRADYSTDSPDLAASERRPVHNLIHASGDVLEADRELKLWFPES